MAGKVPPKTTVTTPNWSPGEEQQFVLHELGGGAGRASIALERMKLFVGRAPSEEPSLEVDDERMSRTHARFERLPVGFYALYDCDSKNGTWHNGEPASGRPVVYGDVLRIGDTVWVCGPALAEGSDPSAPLIGRSQSMARGIEQLRKFAVSGLTILLLGESGTGKEVSARWAHELSRREGAFVAINCASIPAQLIERELFGHVRGAYTSADRGSAGYIEAAAGGTLFLDEIGELPLELQPKLLRFLEERSYSPLGTTKSRNADVRIIAATNQELPRLVRVRQFREDLFSRLDEATITLPPLRERKEDLSELCRALLARDGRHDAPLTADAIEALALHDWPRNVRELEKVLKRLNVLKAGEARFEWTDLPDEMQTPIRERMAKRLDDSY
ncbi:MAG: sigma 54-interacting transcriptional regulator, partial [Myxococcales bacterium]|nr:sigma 54-interacting transcriptional regulator [Myxococcales bacterium]